MGQAKKQSTTTSSSIFRSPNAPTSASIALHHVDVIKADANPRINGCLHLTFQNDGWEIFDFAVFTGDGPLSAELAEAVNAVLRKHGRLIGAAAAQRELVEA